MIKILLVLMSLGMSARVLASGCDSNYFYDGTIAGQTVEKDYGVLTPDDANKVLAQMTSIHKKALHTWSQAPVIESDSHLKMVITVYKGLDTDCGWSHFGATLFITQLEIINDNESRIYPDIYKDIYPEYGYLGPDEYIRIEK